MISAFDLWQKMIGRANTHQGGPVKPNRNFIDWVNDISLEIFEEEYEQWEKSQIVSDRLMPFLQSVNVVVTPQPGSLFDVVRLPADYEHFSSARMILSGPDSCGIATFPTIDCNGQETKATRYIDADELAQIKRDGDSQIQEREITKVTNNRWGSIMQHRRLFPTVEAPKCTQFNGGLKIAPKGLGIIVLDYFKQPRKATFDYTIINPGLETEFIQYNSTTSIQLEWSATMVNAFLERLLKNYGTFTRDQQIYEQAQVNLRGTA